MTDWRVTTLGEICDRPMYGAIASAEELKVGPRLVRQTDIKDGRIHWRGVPYAALTEEDARKFSLREGDLLISRLGSVGNVARMDATRDAVFAGYLVRFRVRESVADDAFVYYALRTPDWKRHVRAHQSGAVQATFNAQQMADFELKLPPLEEQKRIASVLGAFDDLIETDRRLITKLHQTAQLAADMAGVSASGQTMTFEDVADIGGGGTPSTSKDEYWDGEHPWATPKDITALPSPYLFDTPRKLTDAGLAKCSSPLRPVGSILMTSRATVGEFAIAQVPVAVNQGFIVVNGDHPWDTTWLYFEMLRRVGEFRTIAAKGSTFPEISKREFRPLVLTWPSEEVRRKLHEVVAPLIEAGAELQREVMELTEKRDELLPLLMSGQVRVSEAETLVP